MRFKGIPGKVAFRVAAIYYPNDGDDNVRDFFHGISEADAVQAIRTYLAALESQNLAYRSPKYRNGAEWDFSLPPQEPLDIETPEYKNKEAEVSVSGRGASLRGTVWVVNFGTHHKCRIPAEQEAEYKEKGYVRGGPTTKV